jgi:preprotein translocase subunit SecF
MASGVLMRVSFQKVSLLALIFYGGEVLFSFSMATFFGILIGTYSSIYISAPILLYFDPRKTDKK